MQLSLAVAHTISMLGMDGFKSGFMFLNNGFFGFGGRRRVKNEVKV